MRSQELSGRGCASLLQRVGGRMRLVVGDGSFFSSALLLF